MSVIREHPYIDENKEAHENLIRHYSNSGKMIRQVDTGNIYIEAVDVYPCRYTYEETEQNIPEMKEDEIEEYKILCDAVQEILPKGSDA